MPLRKCLVFDDLNSRSTLHLEVTWVYVAVGEAFI
ncbi:MAG: hypothetical protein ACI9C4_001423 [Paraglaciecola sp.]|jgi:hypothetical protein